MYQWIRRGAAGTLVLAVILWGVNLWYGISLPNQYYVSQGEDLVLTQRAVVAVETVSDQQAVMSSTHPQNQTLSLFGIMPIKTVAVQECQDLTVIPSGEAFGVKMFSQGAVVVGFSPVVTAQGTKEPYQGCDIQEGDIICKVNNKEVTRNEEISYLIRESGGEPMELTLQREDGEHTVTLTPVLSSTDGTYKSGLWVRGSAAGIGTVTFINADTETFAGLGHPITDPDTGTILPVESGEVCPVTIHSITKGTAGEPGELDGVFASNLPLGNILLNNQTGVYGTLTGLDLDGMEPVELGYKQEVEAGPATVLCALTDGEPREYDIEICSVSMTGEDDTKNLVIQVTDPDLLDKTGGIVQGMSGTPILQNGKLVGAVTHVFVNDPTMGYGIFAETMVEQLEQVEEAAW